MTTDAPLPTRRALRAQSTDPSAPVPPSSADADDRDHVIAVAADGVAVAPAAATGEGGQVVASVADPGAPAPRDSVVAVPARPLALLWVDEAALVRPALATSTSDGAPPPAPDLLARAPRRSPLRPGVLIPLGLLALIVAVYCATTLLWPLYAIAPRVESVTVQPVPAAAAAPAWPAQGGAAIAVSGIDGSLTNSGEVSSMASVAKVVTALVVLDRMPLAVGESGPEYRFTSADRSRYWADRANGESALDVPVGGTLTQYQLLEGMLIGSANNYADRLAGNLWPSDAVYASAANAWLSTHGITGITIADPSGIEAGNTASAEALIPLAERALADPVIAEIVSRTSVELPGAGVVENTNTLLADPGVVGIKTGTLDAYNLLSAKDVVVGDTTVRIFASVMGQPDAEARDAATRALFASTEDDLQTAPSVAAGTVAGRVVTEWGESVDLVTAGDATVVLFDGASATVTPDYALGDAESAGATVGSLAVAGPLDSTSVDLQLAGEIDGPSAWWRLTHPLDLFGLG